jgi:ArsR family transcriptional regulator
MTKQSPLELKEPVKLRPDRAAMFKALGEPTRLRIFEFLRSCCCPVSVDDSGDIRPASGPTVGEVCCRITGDERITSTISEHLKELRIAGLITVERRGKNMVCGVNEDAVSSLGKYLLDNSSDSSNNNCCGDKDQLNETE